MAFLGAAAGALLVQLAVGWMVPNLSVLRHVDDVIRGMVLNDLPGPVRLWLDEFARRGAPVALAAASALLTVLALAKGRFASAAAAVAIPALAVLLALRFRPRGLFGPDPGYPSNHATVAFALLAACLVAWPGPVRRSTAIVAGLIALALAVGNVSWYAHRPWEVLGSALLVLGVTFLTLAVLGRRAIDVTAPRRPHATPRRDREPSGPT